MHINIRKHAGASSRFSSLNNSRSLDYESFNVKNARAVQTIPFLPFFERLKLGIGVTEAFSEGYGYPREYLDACDRV